MAARDNAFYIEPANPLQALLTGVQGFDRSRKNLNEDEMKAGRLEAMQTLQGGGDIRGPLAKLIGIGDTKGAEAIATYANNQATQQFHQQSLAESTRHNTAIEGQSRATLDETRRLHDTTMMQPVKIGSDAFGADIYAVRDPKSGTYRAIDPKTGGQAGLAQTDAPTGQQSLTGEDFLKTLDPGRAALVKKVAGYEIDPRTFSTKGGHRERTLSAVAQYDPNYDMATFPARSQAVKSFATGSQGNAVRSFDVAIDHLHTVRELASALQNGDVKMVNEIRNRFKDQFGYDAPSNFDAAKSIVGAEIAKAITGSDNALADREELRTPLNNAKSFDQLAGVIDKVYKPLMAGQLKGLKKQYEDTTGLKNFNDRVSEITRKELLGKEQNITGSGTTVTGVNVQNSPAPPPGFQLVK